MTREIDNFFPGLFDYFNIRVYDEETTDLLKYWDNTFKYITKARLAGSKVLVHCKMGVSRSASVVIAYAMKENKWDFRRALQHVKDKRNCIKPNKGFTAQLETYQGILAAMRNKEKLQRSKSETNLKSSSSSGKDARLLPGSEPTPLIQALNGKQRNVYSTYRRYQSSSLKAGHLKRTNCEKSVVVCDSSSSSSVVTKEEKKLQEDQQTLTEFLRQNDAAKEEQEEAVAAAVEEKQRRLESNRQFMKNLNIIVRGKKEQQRKYIRNAEREESLKTRPRSWSQQFGHLDGTGMRIGVGFPMAPVRQLSQSLENLLVVDKRVKGRRKRGEAQTTRSSSSSNNSNNSSSGNNSDSSSANVEAKRGRRAGSSWKFSKTTKTVRLPCSNGQNYSVSQNKIVHLTPESNNSNASFLAAFVGGSPGNSHNKSMGDEVDQEGDEVTLRRRNLSSTSVRLIVNEIESSNGPQVAVNAAPATATIGRGQRDKKAMSLNLSAGKEDGVPEKAKSVSKVILKCDSSPIINLQVKEGEVYDPPPTVMIVEGDKEKRPKKMRMDTTTTTSTDAFSKTVDRVFDREEKKQARNSVLLENQVPMNTTITLNTLTGGGKDCLISRQSSWSSVDSACVMGGYPSESNLRDLPSRHSSWGSGDTSRTTPSRNSSWGSYDMRTNPMSLPKSGGTCLEEDGDGTMEQQQLTGHEDVPWHPGTVRRTKQKIEAREKNKTTTSVAGQQPPVKMRSWGRTLSISGGGVGESSSRSLSEEALLAKSKRNTICGESGGALLICPPGYSEQLSVSAPSSSTSNSSCCSTYTAVNLRDGGGCCAAAEELDMLVGGEEEEGEGEEGSMPPAATGMVHNLKMNFENHHILMSGGDEEEVLSRKVTCRSLPSSPVEIKREEFLLLPVGGGLARRQQGFIVSSSSSEEEEQQQQQQQQKEKQRQQQQRVEKKNVKNLVGRYETTKVQLRSPDARKGGSAAMRQRPKSQIIMDRRPMGGGGGNGGGGSPFAGQLSATLPNSDVQSVQFQRSAFGRPLMMTHNKISMKGIYNDNSSSAGGQGGGGKMKPTSPRPPPVPVVGMAGCTGQQKNVLGNRMNVNHSNHPLEKGGGGVVTSGGNSGGGVGLKGFGLKKAPGQQQQGKTHPLTKLSLAYRQH